MGGQSCCYKEQTYDFRNPSEKYIRDIVSKMRITNVEIGRFKKILNKEYHRNFRMKRIFFNTLMEEYYYDTDEKNNVYKEIHERIFSLYCDSILNFASKQEIIMKIYPLLNRGDTACCEHDDFVVLCKKM